MSRSSKAKRDAKKKKKVNSQKEVMSIEKINKKLADSIMRVASDGILLSIDELLEEYSSEDITFDMVKDRVIEMCKEDDEDERFCDCLEIILNKLQEAGDEFRFRRIVNDVKSCKFRV